ncbi:MAG: 4-hydroxythreonine-4-phosphate dehydrogenase PdxA [bacterium]
MTNHTPLPLALTCGEPAGIGTEITIKAWQYFKTQIAQAKHYFFLLDDPLRVARLARDMGLGNIIATITRPHDAIDVFADKLPILPLPVEGIDTLADVTLGRPNPKTAKLVSTSIEEAVKYALKGEISGLVTNPIQKKTMADAGFNFPGHTEFLGDLTKTVDMPQGAMRGPVMMLAGDDLRVVPATIHIPLAQVPNHLSSERLIKITIAVAQALVRDFAIEQPRIAMAGLNPHAGENGMLGTEDKDIILPAITELRKNGLHVAGPFPADTMFHEEARAQYHAAIAMYHDQALIPVKTIDFHSAVNITLGLPIIRTSPDHGTALPIAGKGIARAESLIAAIKYAAMMAQNRSQFDDTHKALDNG